MRTVFRTAWFSIEAIEMPSDGDGEPYYVMSGPPNVLVLPILPDGRVLMVRQFRHTLQRETLEFPAGHVDAGETPERAALRELKEETGYSGTLLHLGDTWLGINRDASAYHCFAAVDAKRIGDAEEGGIGLEILDIDALRHLLAGACDSLALSGIAALAALRLGAGFPLFDKHG